MTENIGEAIAVARLEVRADNAEKDIADLYGKRDEDRKEIDALRRSWAWLMGAGAIIGGALTMFGKLIVERLS